MKKSSVEDQLEETRRVFEQLRGHIAGQRELSQLLPVAIELELQAEKLAKGENEIGSLTSSIPKIGLPKHLAEPIIAIVSRLPPIGQDFSEDTKLALATLLGNLVVGITGSLILDPELAPGRLQATQRKRVPASLVERDGRGFLLFAELRGAQGREEYPFTIPAIRFLQGQRLDLNARATILVGENGSGKSTLVEAIAVAAGFNAEGGTKNFRFATRASESPLHRCMRLARSHRRPQTGFFFRAESFFNVATTIEELDREPAVAPPIIQSYGGRSLHEQSHGESFMALVQHRFGPEGLYILDEPEAALSVRRQIELLTLLREHVEGGSQFIIATHSPILMSLPEAWIYELRADGIRRVAYQETEAFRLTSQFLKQRSEVQ